MNGRTGLTGYLLLACAAAALLLGACKASQAVSADSTEYTADAAAGSSAAGIHAPGAATSESAENTDAGITAPADAAAGITRGFLMTMVTAILECNEGRYLEGECPAAGFDVLDQVFNKDRLTVYALTVYGEYGFQDGNFVKVSGSGVIPTVLTFDVLGNETYQLLDYEQPEDGSGYETSIHNMFPEALWQQCLVIDKAAKRRAEEMERMCAFAYLESIGREAAIGEYRDFPHPLLTSQGVSVEVADMVTDRGDRLGYPSWIGNLEQIEDGVRYVYEMSYDRSRGLITYRKWRADSGETAEEIKFDSMTGRQIE